MSCPGYKYFLCCCMTMKNEGKFLNEWLDHYINEGVEHFYLIDNGSTDNTPEIIKQYDNITLFKDSRQYGPNQEGIYCENLTPIIKESKWCIIVDADELITGQNGYTIKTYLEKIPDSVGTIYVIWKMFMNKTNKVDKMKDIKTRFNYDYLNDSTMYNNGHFWKHLQYFLMFGKSIFRTQNINKLRVHKTVSIGNIIDNFNKPDTYFPDTLISTCEHINEEALKKADIVLNHYFIKTRKEYEHRVKKSKEKDSWYWCAAQRAVGWDYLGFLIRLYNLEPPYLIEES